MRNALLKLGTRVLDLAERVEKNGGIAKSAQEGLKREQKAREEASKTASELKGKCDNLQSLLKSEKEKVSRLQKDHDENLELLHSEQGTSARFRTELERMTKVLNSKEEELRKVTELLGKAKEEALTNYNIHIASFLQSKEYEKLLYE